MTPPEDPTPAAVPETFELPMFPLGTVLLPGSVLPLRVFEPRYRTLMAHVRAGDLDPSFGVVLIERGREVGGGEQRFGVGAIARIVAAEEHPDGQWILQTVGTHRIRVHDWLPDDPYPRALVERWDDPAPGDDVAVKLDATLPVLRRVLAMASELGAPIPTIHVELPDDPVLASYQLVALAPVGLLDRLTLLAAETVGARLDEVRRLLDETSTLLALRLERG